jgi:hypothetical protein
MAYVGPELKLTGLTASADLSAKQFYFVKISGDNTVTVCAAATDKPIGVLQNAPTSGQEAEVTCIGQTKVSADAGLTAGALIGTSGDGQADPKTPGTDTTEYVVGAVISGVSNAAELATVVINCASPCRAA